MTKTAFGPERIRLIFFFAFAGLALISGCVRVTGTAGYWSQGKDGEAETVRQAGFDTNELLPGDPASGRITV